MKTRRQIQAIVMLGVLCSTLSVNAQQNPLYTQYMFNGLVINPAYAGSHQSLSLTGMFRKQWTGMEGAPSTQTFTAHTPLKKQKAAIGLLLLNDNIGVTHTYGFNGVYAYRLSLSDHQKLSFGLQAGVSRYVSNFSSLKTRDPNDPSFSTDAASAYLINIGTGAYYYSDLFYAGFSIPQLLKHEPSDITEGSIARQHRNYLFTTGYIFKLSPELKLKPSTLVKLVEGAPVQVDINCNLLIKEVLWVGLSYRSFSSLNALLQIQLSDQLAIGYSYDSMLNKIGTITRGSHEFMMTYNFNFFGLKVVSPRYF